MHFMVAGSTSELQMAGGLRTSRLSRLMSSLIRHTGGPVRRAIQRIWPAGPRGPQLKTKE